MNFSNILNLAFYHRDPTWGNSTQNISCKSKICLAISRQLQYLLQRRMASRFIVMLSRSQRNQFYHCPQVLLLVNCKNNDFLKSISTVT